MSLIINTIKLCFLIVSISVGFLSSLSAQETFYLNAKESKYPEKLGWMNGFPPPADKIIMQPQSNYFSFPKLRWTVCHIRELLPTKQVSRGVGTPIPFNYFIDKEIDSITFTPLDSNRTITWADSLFSNYTDGILILHKGKIVYEKYLGCLKENGKHAAMSMTKSLTGT